jgi:hypothetical protein
VVQEATKVFPWDHFLDEAVRIQVEGFRRVEWPNIRRDLGKTPFNVTLPDGLEPCWVTPGKAIFWQEQKIRRPVTKTDDDGRQYREMEDFSDGWAETNPFPANNASVLAYHLQKGLRLRPPGQEVVEIETATPSESPARTIEYRCYRHGYSKRGFKTWKAYVQHYLRYQEAPEYDAPPEVLALQQKFPYFCLLHNKGFNQLKAAKHHMTVESRKPGKAYHPTIADMQVSQNIEK